MESWRNVWRVGFAPQFSRKHLDVLRDALREDDARLVQGWVCNQPPLVKLDDWPCTAFNAIGFCGWHGEQFETVGQVEEFFAKCCYEADNRLGEPAACRWFLNWFDDTPRHEMLHELLAEVELALRSKRWK